MLSIIVPAYNEENTVTKMLDSLISTLKLSNINYEIIIINDGSKDDTLNLINNYSKNHQFINILDNSKNIGKSQSVKKGILASKGDFVIIQDSDLEYLPTDILVLMERAKTENLDFVYGNRFNGKVHLLYRSYYIGNKGISFVSNLFTYPKLRKVIPDMEVCYKLIKGDIARDIAKNLNATSNFGFEPEVTAKLARYKVNGKHLKFEVIPISYFPRTIEQGKKIRWMDGIKAVVEIIKYNLF